ncbi:YdeI/OmpD-associated family protein [Aequorivita echinoideorum]|uniref:YdeI/OmpD-associated family protein n=1 Tax=Aequorivita echinoideorum TaxID=1549647 RepID=A0ABS5S6N0_9FLAO|nr:YdeI/OmpD-associated family protein [Aequorivita echinoideorum]MBT0608873.1 YdeI/OmpD-associated family protein [Aequorivita echinoideorum]
MDSKMELYFKTDAEWREWLHENHQTHTEGVYLILYKLETNIPTMRWEEAVKVALCYGWIDSTSKSMGEGKRRQYFCPRRPKSVWSAVNKNHLKELQKQGLIHKSGKQAIAIAKKNGSWSALDDVENLIIPEDLKKAFGENPIAFENYKTFNRGAQKSYLYWLNQAKRTETRMKRILEIIDNCEKNIKYRT